ncbi:HTTM domain-containing protein [Bdellovibrio reynosensis]|uniref:HTTM domain-containing protein n=1 Tax=Bdellovibrio reynosensis TaxID=2835041 RepID=A0ABY4CC07_9BACT|nr:HTTM domain-containing protein [Bdellovibrio reynosensis]UOF02480.1 HTTM domain-containing protein [Bdellovibrio reynosensis]
MKKLILEVQKHPALRIIGVIFCLEHLLTILFWLTERPLHWILSPSNAPICWPFFSSCELFKPSPGILNFILVLYGLFAIAGAIAWWNKKVRLATSLLLILILFKISIIALDYRLTGNYHYLPTMLALVFLLIPERRFSLTVSFFIIYFTAGVLKINSQWLTGTAINDHIMPSYMTTLGVWYVLVLELGLIFFLFSKKDRWFYFLFFQLVYFHLYSWHLTRFFYPVVMLSLLGILLIVRPTVEEWNIKESFKKAFSTKTAQILLLIFLILQLPQYLIPGNSALTGEGRMYAMIMYDGRVQCQPHLSIWKKDGSKEDLSLQPPWLMTRTQCDPLIYWRLAQKTCEWVKNDNSIIQVDLAIPIRNDKNSPWHPLVSTIDVCRNNYAYYSFFPNSWINKIDPSSYTEAVEPEEEGGGADGGEILGD